MLVPAIAIEAAGRIGEAGAHLEREDLAAQPLRGAHVGQGRGQAHREGHPGCGVGFVSEHHHLLHLPLRNCRLGTRRDDAMMAA